MEPITGRCRALDDTKFNLTMKTATSYDVSVNFTCDFKIYNNTKKLIGINLLINYEIAVVLQPKYMDFFVKSITGVPTFF